MVLGWARTTWKFELPEELLVVVLSLGLGMAKVSWPVLYYLEKLWSLV